MSALRASFSMLPRVSRTARVAVLCQRRTLVQAAVQRLPVAIVVPKTQRWAVRSYSSGGGLSKDEITDRVLEIMKSFEKVDPAKLKTASAFVEDLGLDSLDAVEVVMAVEEEFSIEIPDVEADEIKTVQEAIDYISKTPEAT